MRDLPDALPVERLAEHHRKWLGTLPRTLQFETPIGSLLLCHGLGDSDMATLMPDDEGYALEVNDQLHALIRPEEGTQAEWLYEMLEPLADEVIVQEAPGIENGSARRP
jgi:hypothetical protein